MKIALIEPLGVPEQTLDRLSAPLKDAGHEFVYFDTKTTDPAELARRSEGTEVVMIANNPLPCRGRRRRRCAQDDRRCLYGHRPRGAFRLP